MLYLDYAASTPIRAAALEVLNKSMAEDYANPSSAHKFGKNLGHRIEDYRKKFLGLLDAKPVDRVIFTGSATESNNTVIRGLPLKQGDAVMISPADHPSVTAPVEFLNGQGIHTVEIPMKPGGSIDEPGLFERLDDTVKLVILAHVNNHSGTVTDVTALSKAIKAKHKKIHIHVDSAQGFGKLPLSLQDGVIDSVSFASHKIGGPKGIAALYLRAGVDVPPLLLGGSQELGLRSSTQAAPLIYSFCEAAKEAVENMDEDFKHVEALNKAARDGLKKITDAIDFPFVKTSSPYILAFLLHGISSDIILRHMEQEGIMISTSSACSSKIKGTNPVFTALHVPPQSHKFVIRVSFAHETTMADIETFCSTFAKVYDGLKMYLFKR